MDFICWRKSLFKALVYLKIQPHREIKVITLLIFFLISYKRVITCCNWTLLYLTKYANGTPQKRIDLNVYLPGCLKTAKYRPEM